MLFFAVGWGKKVITCNYLHIHNIYIHTYVTYVANEAKCNKKRFWQTVAEKGLKFGHINRSYLAK